jgi:hypothetical protein
MDSKDVFNFNKDSILNHIGKTFEYFDGKSALILCLMVLYFMTFLLWLGYISDPIEFPIITCIPSTIVVIVGTIWLIFFDRIQYKIKTLKTTLKLQRNLYPETYSQLKDMWKLYELC